LRAGPRERLRYWFDNTMSRGTPALIGWLGLASVALILSVSGLLLLFTPGDVGGNPLRALWMSLMRSIDSGAISGDSGSPLFLGLMLALTIGGIFIVSALVGVLAAGLNTKLEELRKGRSRVVERGHVVVLGWSEQLFTIISELGRTGERECVTILANRDKVEMEDEIAARVRRTGRLRVVCRSGDPTAPADLEIVRPDQASVILVPTPAGADADIHLIKVLLSLHHRTWPAGRPPVVATVADSTNMPAAVLAGGPGVHLVDAEDITARLLVQSRRHPGLSAVCAELLTFDGNEIYMSPEPGLVGATYGDALSAYRTAVVFGIRQATGTVVLNPPSHTLIEAGDELIVVAADQASIARADTPFPVLESAISTTTRPPYAPEPTLILGWNDRGPTIVHLLDAYLPAGSTIHVAATRSGTEIEATLRPTRNLTVTSTQCDPTSRAALQALDPARYDHVMVLADDTFAEYHADSRTLVTLLHLRDMKERAGDVYGIVSELNDDANRRLAQITQADDFVVSTRLISLLSTQVAKNQHLTQVFAELFDPSDADIFLEPADGYLVPGATADFATVIEAARRRGETAIGYRLQAHAHIAPLYGVVLNPDKTAPLRLTEADRVVVIGKS
jgi:voltage-gated potassium channel Kch